MRILITGFDPFGGEAINPSWEAVKRLPERIGGIELTKLEVPTVFGEAADAASEAIDRLSPHAVICVGQAGGRGAVTPEVVAINLREASIPDNKGNAPSESPVVEGGPDAYFSTLPIRKMVSNIKAAGLSGSLSYTAGAFVCNDLMYTLLHRYSGRGMKIGFIHVPYLPEQAKNGEKSMTLEDIISALAAAIGALEPEEEKQ